MDDDNIFDEDDALDYIIYEETQEKNKQIPKGGGCLTLIVLIPLPLALVCSMVFKI